MVWRSVLHFRDQCSLWFAKIRFPVVLLSVFMFLLPWQTQKVLRLGQLSNGLWEYGTIGLYATQLIIVVLLVWHRRALANDCRSLIEHVRVSVMALSCWLLLSIGWSIDPLLVGVHILWIVELVFIVWLFYQAREHVSVLIWAFTVGMVFQASVAIAQVLNQDTIVNAWLGWTYHDPTQGGTSVIEIEGRRFLRGYGGMGHPNVLGGYLAVALLLLVSWMRRELPRIKNEFVLLRRSALSALSVMVSVWLGFLLLLAGLFFTFSRSAWGAFVLGIIVLIVCEFRRSRATKVTMTNRSEWLKMIIAIVLVFASLGWFWREPFLARVESNGRLETKSIEDRRVQFFESLVVLKGHWVQGTGLGNYTDTLAAVDPKPTLIEPMFHQVMKKPAWMYQPVHNVFLLALSELGIIGLVLLMWVLNDCWKVFRSRSQRLDSTHSLPAGQAGALLTTLFILALADHYLWSLHAGWLLIGLVIGIVISAGKKEIPQTV